jgi:hypothetical protein
MPIIKNMKKPKCHCERTRGNPTPQSRPESLKDIRAGNDKMSVNFSGSQACPVLDTGSGSGMTRSV